MFEKSRKRIVAAIMSVLTLLPVVLIFILCQRFFVQGLTAGSVKG